MQFAVAVQIAEKVQADWPLAARMAYVQFVAPVLPQNRTARITGPKADYEYHYTSKDVAWYAARRLFGAAGVAVLAGEDPATPIMKDGTLTQVRALVTLLFGISPLDPLTHLGVIGLLLAVAAGACWVPAWRAARVDPAVTLRAE